MEGMEGVAWRAWRARRARRAWRAWGAWLGRSAGMGGCPSRRGSLFANSITDVSFVDPFLPLRMLSSEAPTPSDA